MLTTTIGFNPIRRRFHIVLTRIIAPIVIIYGNIRCGFIFFFLFVLSLRLSSSNCAFFGSVTENAIGVLQYGLKRIFSLPYEIVRETHNHGRRGNGPWKNRLHCETLRTFDRRIRPSRDAYYRVTLAKRDSRKTQWPCETQKRILIDFRVDSGIKKKSLIF